MANDLNDIEEKKRKEWLQLIEFIRRKYGEDKADLVTANGYLNRGTKSVYEYYSAIDPSIGSTNLELSKLLKNRVFLSNVLDSTPENISEFTDIYTETDTLIKTLSTSGDNIYIKCNPTDSNGNVIDENNNTQGTSTSSLNTMFNELGITFSPMFLYNNVGMQTFISILFFIMIYYIGTYIFINYPRSIISKNT